MLCVSLKETQYGTFRTISNAHKVRCLERVQNGNSSRSSKNIGRFGIKDLICAFTRSAGVVKANNKSLYASAGDSERTVSYVSMYSRYDSYFSGPSDESFMLSPRHASLCMRNDAEMTTELILWRLQYATNWCCVIILFVFNCAILHVIRVVCMDSFGAGGISICVIGRGLVQWLFHVYTFVLQNFCFAFLYSYNKKF